MHGSRLRAGASWWHRARGWLIHLLRLSLVVGLLATIPSPAVETLPSAGEPPPMDKLPWVDGLGESLRISPQVDANGMWPLLDQAGKTKALVARTLPQAADVVGYRGPTEAAIVLTPDLNIAAVGVLQSADTEEHVEVIRNDHDFYRQFQGWSWGETPADLKIDGVSGATLTSLAFAEGILKRIGQQRPSLVFPDPLDRSDVSDWFPTAVAVEPDGTVVGPGGQHLGTVIRTGPLVDDVIGYQGPTELIFRMATGNVVTDIQIRTSFDNQPYVRYVRQERGFWPTFTGKTLKQLAEFSPQAAEVEGVSGATMTSLAVADTVVAAARQILTRRARADSDPGWFEMLRPTVADVAAVVLLFALAIVVRRRWFTHRWLRRLWLTGVVMVIGFWSGNLISLALIAGWSAEGIAWRLAPGLTIILGVAVLIPPVTKRNPYCSHLCPHGALQQLIKPHRRSKRHRHLSGKNVTRLQLIPGITLVLAYLCLIAVPSTDLASWEPFHAYLIGIAGIGAWSLAVVSLSISAFIPMAYCRYGCPTGRLIDYLRRTATSHRLQRADAVAVATLASGITIRWFMA